MTGYKMAVQRFFPPDDDPELSELKILWPENLEDAEPIIDRTRWARDGVLTMLIQKNGQPPHDKGGIPGNEPVYLIDWDISGGWDSPESISKQ
ncbi:MAG: hypothetical protein PF482_12050 [Desulfobacteraceae bacterium]|nr:hypothetical protein [Desulfobacteraceae bacterium]